MREVTVHYMIADGGDGSASLHFFPDEQTTQFACEVAEEWGDAFEDQGPHRKTLKFDDKGLLVSPVAATADELTDKLSEMRGEEIDVADYDCKGFFTRAATPSGVVEDFTIEFWYVVRNNGDGSASVDFYPDGLTAELAAQIDMDGGEAFSENPHQELLAFDKNNLLLSPYSTAEELRQERAERSARKAGTSPKPRF